MSAVKDQEQSEMDAKIQNAFHSIGVEAGFRHGFKRPDLEFMAYTIKWIAIDAGWVDPRNKHSQEVEKILNDGWWLTDKIICPPFVMLIFSREKETEENEREQ